jgi:hypothetical protein
MLPVAIVLWAIAAFGVKACATKTIASRRETKAIFVARLGIMLFPRLHQSKGGRGNARLNANGLP